MTRRSKQNDPELFRKELIGLLINFEEELRKGDLRLKVLALVPALNLLRDLGSSLIPRAIASSARDRIIHYFRKYPCTIINGHELTIVSGISEWARRVRELRVQFGWSIITGDTAREMAKEGESPIDVKLSQMGPDDYLLISAEQDRVAAHRWHIANEIRRSKQGSRDKLIEYFRRNIGEKVTGEELRYVANNSEWARRVRELRTEFGWPVLTKYTGMPELPVGVYLLSLDRQAPPHDRKIPDDIRMMVLSRDKYKCRDCGWNHKKRNPSDPRQLLEAHHVKPHAERGANTEDNLITLCNVCHDKTHRKEKE